MNKFIEVLLFFSEHPELLWIIGIIVFVAIILFELESKRYYEKHPEELDDENNDFLPTECPNCHYKDCICGEE